MFGERGRGQVSIGAYSLIVSATERNYVVVRCQNLSTGHGTGSGLGFPAQRRLYFLRHYRAAEDPGERIADGRLEFAFDAVDQTHVTARLFSLSYVASARQPVLPRVALATLLTSMVSAWCRNAGPTEL